MDLKNYIKVADALHKLLGNMLEIVIHDVVQDKVMHISGKMSGREVGDDSLLDLEGAESGGLDALLELSYPKISPDGQLVRAISVPLYDANGELKYLMCINCDVSIFEQMRGISEMFLGNLGESPAALFRNDWKERLHVVLHQYLKREGYRMASMNTAEKKATLLYLYETGAFEQKRAAEYIAEILSVGRATIFKYLREWKNKNNITKK